MDSMDKNNYEILLSLCSIQHITVLFVRLHHNKSVINGQCTLVDLHKCLLLYKILGQMKLNLGTQAS